MLKHLIYCISKGYKVGYGALFTRIFEDYGVDVKNEPVLLPRDENLFGSHSLNLFKFTVVDGKVVEKVEEVSSGETPLVSRKDRKEMKEKEDEEKADVTEPTKEEVKETPTSKVMDSQEKKKGKPTGSSKRKAASHHRETRSVKRRVVRKTANPSKMGSGQKPSSPVEEPQEGQEHVDETKEQPSAAEPSSLERIEQMFQLTLGKLVDLQSEQQNLKESFHLSVVQLEEKLVTLQQTVLDKIDSITVEEMPADDASIPTTAPSVSPV